MLHICFRSLFCTVNWPSVYSFDFFNISVLFITAYKLRDLDIGEHRTITYIVNFCVIWTLIDKNTLSSFYGWPLDLFSSVELKRKLHRFLRFMQKKYCKPRSVYDILFNHFIPGMINLKQHAEQNVYPPASKGIN